MMKCFFSCFGFICLLYSKCAAFSAETTNNFLFYLTSQETKLLSIQELSVIKTTIEKSKFVFLSTYAPGRDALYQGGGALAYYLSPGWCVKTGPSFSRDIGIGKKWKWAMQLNYEIPFAI